MNIEDTKNRSTSIILLSLAGLALISLGCGLTKLEIFSHSEILEDEDRRSALNTLEALDRRATNEAKPPIIDEELKPNSAQEYAWQFGVRCIDAPGDAPCPLDACVVASDQYSARYTVTSELYGKANPDDYQCSASFSFTNNSNDELALMTYYPDIKSWNSVFIQANQVVDWGQVLVSYSRKDGVETIQQGATQIIVTYYNPHCDWLEHTEPGLQKNIVTLTQPCIPD